MSFTAVEISLIFPLILLAGCMFRSGSLAASVKSPWSNRSMYLLEMS